MVLIVVDDLGWADNGIKNGDVFNTPNIDRLAARSLSFSNAYAGAANCAPSRAVLMSGQYPPRHGIYTVSPSDRGHIKTRKLVPTKNTKVLKDEIMTMAEMFKANGYTTGHFGKWHLGEDPKTQGFDHNVGGGHNGHPKTYFSPYDLPSLSNGPKGEYLTNRLTTEVTSWITRVKDKPFFTYLPYYTVHTPIQAIKEVKQRYIGKKGIRNATHATYAAMVEIMDTNVGRIMQSLKDNGIYENTLVVFTSDNGGIRSISYQDPLRAGKGSYYEGGIRVPLLVSWPNKIKPSVSDEAVINLDFFPTFENIIKADKKSSLLDGIDLSAHLFNELPLPQRSLFWHFPVYLQAYDMKADQSRDPLFRTRPGSAMRKGKWKLHHYFEDNSYELYDLSNDLGEHVNFASAYPEVLQQMSAELNEWRKSVNAPIPQQLNSEYDLAVATKLLQRKIKKVKKR
ncbi:sulfatase [Thalassotalea sp. ND16A]|uniref:sulfatase n=1 Tax=Thalassotalea sp. ND16A TaxID=1535422 RepID=UPI001F3CF612|nr:sulfatase [Thalassotalea sp. ND16A]